MDQSIITKYRVKKFLKIISVALLFVFLGLLVFEYVRILPQNVQFTNTSSSSVTVSWTTKYPTKGMAVAKSAKNNIPISLFALGRETFFDTRDVREAELLATAKTAENISEEESIGVKISNFVTERVVTEKGNYYTHHVQLTGLDSQTEYKLMIGDGILFKNIKDNEGISTVQTLEVPESITTPSPAYGSIKNANNENLPIEELLPVEDAIVYFNYLDETTGTKSNIVSSSTTEDGKWYVDISTLTDPEGNNFLEMYDSMEASIWGELTVDAGKLGIWKMESLINEITPFPEVVLNMPDYEEGEGIGILKKISMDNNIFVAKTFAEIRDEDGNLIVPSKTTTPTTTPTNEDATSSKEEDNDLGECIFKSYCSCVWSNKRAKPCSCDEYNKETVIQRNCISKEENNEINKGSQESLVCSGGVKYGGISSLGSTCYKCSSRESNGYYIAAWKPLEDYKLVNGKCENTAEEGFSPANENPDKGVALPSNIEVGDSCDKIGITEKKDGLSYFECDSNKKWKIVYGQLSSGGQGDTGPGDNIKTELVIKPPFKSLPCYDPDGCKCKSDNTLKSNLVKETESCEIIIEVPLKNNDGKKSNLVFTSGSNAFCDDPDGCICESSNKGNLKEINIDEYCVTITSATQTNDTMLVSKNGEVCENPGGCYCRPSWKTIPLQTDIEQGDICSHITKESCENNWMFDSELGKTCDKGGGVCVDQDPKGDGKFKCVSPSESANTKSIKPMNTKIFAQDSTASTYLIDQSTGLVSGLREGIYEFESQGETYIFSTQLPSNNEGVNNVLIYIDNNENNIFEEGVDTKISDLGLNISIKAISEIYNYEFTEGYNFVTFPFLTEELEQRTAAGLLRMINEENGSPIYSIAKYDGSWKIVGENSEMYDTNDFQIVPGQGYIVKAKTNVDISIVGQPVELDTADDSAAISLYPGWNLIGTYGSNVKQYTAKSLIQSINAYEPVDFTANNVSRWESDVQRYDGYQLDIENGAEIEYGFDYPINSLQSYFVRITNGRGNWQQEIEE